MSVTYGADCSSAWPEAGPMSATRPAVVAIATRTNVKRLIMVPPFTSGNKIGCAGDHTRITDAKQLDDSIGETFGSVEDAAPRRSPAAITRFANRAEAATVTARQSRLVDRGGQSLNSDSSSQSSAQSGACSGPNNSVTARMNADNSRSAMLIWSSQVELRN